MISDHHEIDRGNRFDTSFSFIYSARPGTPAAELPDEVPEAVKKRDYTFFRHALRSRRSRLPSRWSVRPSAYWSPAMRKKTRGALGPHRE